MIACEIDECPQNAEGSCKLSSILYPVGARVDPNKCTHRLFVLKMEERKAGSDEQDGS